MDYYTDSNSSFVSAVAFEIPYCKQTGKECIIAVNLMSNEAPANTFWYSGLDTMNNFMSDLWRQYATVGGYTKLRWAIHTYGYYLQTNPPSISSSPEVIRDLYWWVRLPGKSCIDSSTLHNLTNRTPLITIVPFFNGRLLRHL